MDADEARKVILVRAVEASDAERGLLGDAPRAAAERAAREEADPAGNPDAYLAARASRIYEHLAAGSAMIRLAGRPSRAVAAGSVALCAIGFLVGLALNELGSERRINILAVPVLALVAWNVAACLLLLAFRFGRPRVSPGTVQGGWLVDLVERIGALFGGRSRAPGAIESFGAQWLHVARPMYGLQARLVLNLAAVALVLGAVAGMYLRGFAFEYRAGWESTFLDTATVRSLLAVVLGPASAILGEPIPPVAELEAMRSEPAPAAVWIHRYALTTLLFVVVPRILLASADLAGWLRLRRKFPLDWRSDPKLLALTSPGRGGGSVVRILPFSFRPEGTSLERAARACFGDRAEIRPVSPLAYEAEPEDARRDASATRPTAESGRVHHVLLFNAAQTPEGPVHGALASALASAADDPRASLVVLVDESGWRERMAGTPDRLEERRAAWRTVLEQEGVAPRFVDLATVEAPDLAEAP